MTSTENVYMYSPTVVGGHPRYTKELLSALANAGKTDGYDVSLITSENLEPVFETTAYPIHRVFPTLKPRDQFSSRISWSVDRLLHHPRKARRLRRWMLQQPGEGIVHLQEWPVWLGTREIRTMQRRGYRVVLTVHNVRWHFYPRYIPRQVFDRLRVQLFRSCDALFVHSEELKADLSGLLAHDHPPIFVTPHGAWSNAAYVRPEDATTEREERHHLLLFGMLGHYKGVHVLLDALKFLPDDYTLTIAGQPVDEAYGQLIREKVGTFAPGRVELVDRFISEEEIPGLFGKSSLLVLPYVNFNAQSGVLHDAISWNLPVVGTEVGAVGDSIREWKLGEVVEPSNEQELAAAIVRLYEPEPYAAALAGIRNAQQGLSWERTAEATIVGYTSLIGTGIT